MFKAPDKIGWLSTLDGIIKREIIDTHEGYEDITFTPYDTSTPMDTVLLVPDPYSDVYIKYLFTQIDFNNAEIERYNNSVAMYNVAYMLYSDHYNRNNMPLQLNSVQFTK
jgi:hypothetical protein